METVDTDDLMRTINLYWEDYDSWKTEPHRIDFHGKEKRILSCLEKFINQIEARIETRRKKLEKLKTEKIYELDNLDNNEKNALADTDKLKSLLFTLVVTMTEVRVSRRDNWNGDPNKSFFTYGLQAWKKPEISKLLSSELNPDKVYDLKTNKLDILKFLNNMELKTASGQTKKLLLSMKKLGELVEKHLASQKQND